MKLILFALAFAGVISLVSGIAIEGLKGYVTITSTGARARCERVDWWAHSVRRCWYNNDGCYDGNAG